MNKNNIILVGMPGAGKTYIGEKLSQKLEGFKFVDTDSLIEQKTGMTIVDIFTTQGEKAFREEETNVINDVVKKSKQVIAIGGGAFNNNNIDILKQNGIVFYLQASINLLYERIKNESTRPLLLNTDNVKDKLAKMLNAREDNFKLAHYTIYQDKFETDELIEYIKEQYITLNNSIDILKYPVFVTNEEIDLLCNNIKKHVKGKAIIVIDESVEKLYGKQIDFAPKFVLKKGEKQKNLENYKKIINFATNNNLERSDTIIAIGGGVTGDLTGFVAATYLRGINLIHVPTTLLACVDSSIGGKTGINSDYGKNLIGAFYQPVAVFCNLKFLKTLDEKQFKTGLAEVLKYAFIENSCGASTKYNLLDILENSNDKILNRDEKTIKDIIKICIELKETVVLKDEKENGLRRILNFGHTLGHAIEKQTNFRTTHGEAVAQGMIYAFELAYQRRLIGEAYYKVALNTIKKYNLMKPLPKIDEKIINLMAHDKKVKDGKINFILPYYVKAVEAVKIDPQSLQ